MYIAQLCCAQNGNQPVASDSVSAINTPAFDEIQWYTMFSNIPRDWSRWYDISFRKERLNEWLTIGGLTVATI